MDRGLADGCVNLVGISLLVKALNPAKNLARQRSNWEILHRTCTYSYDIAISNSFRLAAAFSTGWTAVRRIAADKAVRDLAIYRILQRTAVCPMRSVRPHRRLYWYRIVQAAL